MNPAAIVSQLSVVHLLILSVVVVTVAGWASDRVKDRLVLKPYRVVKGDFYRLVTAGWLHGDFGHLAMNMFVLWMFAAPVRRVVGDVMFLGIYLTAVPVAYLPTVLRHKGNSGYKSLGASGATAALMLSAILLDATLKVGILFIPVRIPGVVFGAGYIVYSMLHSLSAGDGINHDAHLSGALYGILITFILEADRAMLTIAVFQRMLGL